MRDRVAVAAEPARQPEDVDRCARRRVRPRSARSGSRVAESARRWRPRVRLSRAVWSISGLEMVLERARAGASRRRVPVTSPACASRASACETDGRSAPTSCPSSRWVSGSGSRRPPGSTLPQRAARCQSSSTSRTSSRGWHEIARCTVEIWRPPLGAPAAARARSGATDRTRSGEIGVEQRQPRRAQRPPARAARRRRSSSVLRRGLQQVAGAEQLGRDAVADPRLGRHQPVEQQQPGAGADGLRTSCRAHTRRSRRRACARSRAGARRTASARRAPGAGRRRGRAGSRTAAGTPGRRGGGSSRDHSDDRGVIASRPSLGISDSSRSLVANPDWRRVYASDQRLVRMSRPRHAADVGRCNGRYTVSTGLRPRW